MALYAHLALIYDRVFPLSSAAVKFMDGLCRGEGSCKRLVDLGSATGEHVFAMARRGWEVTGIELSPELAVAAVAKEQQRHTGARLIHADMRKILEYESPNNLTLATCLGNTLPHVEPADLANFLHDIWIALRSDGVLVLQLVNFDLAGPGFAFPDIVEDDFRFERSYSAVPDGRISFDTRLFLSDGTCHEDHTALTPLAPKTLDRVIYMSGFTIESKFAGWDGSAFDPSSSPYLIVVARKTTQNPEESGDESLHFKAAPR